jgi:Domain of unknown function (DUF1843)
MPQETVPGHSVPPYGPAIHLAIAAGDLAQMKALAAETERYLAEHGDVRAALEILKSEIAKLEARRF